MAMKKLSAKEYLGLKTLEKGLKRVFYKYKLPGEFEDFFQRFHVDYLSGYRQTQNWDQFAIDYLRESIGRYGAKTNFNAPLSVNLMEDPEDFGSKIPLEMTELLDIINTFKDRERLILGLYLIHGLQQQELAFLFDVAPITISKITDNLVEKLKRRLRPTYN